MKFQKYYAVKFFFKNNTPSATCWPTGNLSASCRPIGFLQANWLPAGQLVAPTSGRQACRPAAGQSACSKPIGLRQADRVASPPPGSLLLPLSLLLLISCVLRFPRTLSHHIFSPADCISVMPVMPSVSAARADGDIFCIKFKKHVSN